MTGTIGTISVIYFCWLSSFCSLYTVSLLLTKIGKRKYVGYWSYYESTDLVAIRQITSFTAYTNDNDKRAIPKIRTCDSYYCSSNGGYISKWTTRSMKSTTQITTLKIWSCVPVVPMLDNVKARCSRHHCLRQFILTKSIITIR